VGDDMLLTEIDLAIDVGRHLDAVGVRWLVGGSVASSIWGIPRTTVDLDLVADLRGQHIKRLYDTLVPDYYADEDTMHWAVKTRRSFNAIHQGTAIKVDIFCAKDEPLGREELDRRRMLELRGHSVPISSIEDIIIEKLMWYREAGESERQWRDALGVVEVRRDVLDLEYLNRHATTLDLTELLSRLLATPTA